MDLERSSSSVIDGQFATAFKERDGGILGWKIQKRPGLSIFGGV